MIDSEELKIYITAEVDRAIKDLKNYEKELGHSKKTMEDYAKSLNSLGNKMTLAFTAPLAAAATYSIKAAADFEKVRTSYGVLLGDVQKGNKLFEELRNFSASTPLQMEDINAASQTLLSFGFSANNLVGTLRTLGDAAMGDADKFGRLSLAIGKVKVKGKADLENINQIAEAGVPIIEELAKGYGLAAEETGKVFEKISKGEVSFDDLNQAMIRLTSSGGKFSGMMDKMSQTTAGKLSTAMDNFKIAMAGFGSVALPVVNDLLNSGTKFFEWLGNLDEGEKKLLMISGALLALVGPAAKATSAIMKLHGAIKGIGGLSGGLSKVGGLLSGLAPMLANPITLGLGGAALVGGVVASSVNAKNKQFDNISNYYGTPEETNNRESLLSNRLKESIEEGLGFESIKNILPGLTENLFDLAKETGNYIAVVKNATEIEKNNQKIKEQQKQKREVDSVFTSSILDNLNSAINNTRVTTHSGIAPGSSYTSTSRRFRNEDKQLNYFKNFFNNNGKDETALRSVASYYGIEIEKIFKNGTLIEIKEAIELLTKSMNEVPANIKEIEKENENLSKGENLKKETVQVNSLSAALPTDFSWATNQYEQAITFLQKTVGLGEEEIQISAKIVVLQQQYNSLVSEKNKLLNKGEKADSDTVQAIETQLTLLGSQIEDFAEAKKLRDNLAHLYELDKITSEDILAEGSSLLEIGKALYLQDEEQRKMVEKRTEFFNSLDEAIKELEDELAKAPETNKEQIDQKLKAAKALKAEIENGEQQNTEKNKYNPYFVANPGKDFGIAESALIFTDGLMKSISEAIENEDLGEAASVLKENWKGLTEELGSSLEESGVDQAIVGYVKGAMGIAESVVTGAMALSDSLKKDAPIADIASQSMDMIIGAGAGIANMFGPFGPIVEAAGGLLSSVITMIIKATDYLGETERAIKENSKSVLELMEDNQKEEEKFANLRNQYIDENLEKQKKAHQEEMALIDAKSQAELKNLEAMRQAGVISAKEYESQYAEIVTRASKDKGEVQEKVNQENADLERFKNYANKQEENLKKSIEDNKADYERIYKASYEEGKTVVGTGQYRDLYLNDILSVQHREGADNYERYIGELEVLLNRLQKGEIKSIEEFDKEFKNIKGPYAAAEGADFTTNGPTMILAGEAGAERVRITPAPKNNHSGGETVTVNIVNPIGIDGLTHQVIESVKVLDRRGR